MPPCSMNETGGMPAASKDYATVHSKIGHLPTLTKEELAQHNTGKV
jgi:hypothetical protein